ncbi:MAG: hypothetical protein WCJ70_03165 [bacterium]
MAKRHSSIITRVLVGLGIAVLTGGLVYAYMSFTAQPPLKSTLTVKVPVTIKNAKLEYRGKFSQYSDTEQMKRAYESSIATFSARLSQIPGIIEKPNSYALKPDTRNHTDEIAYSRLIEFESTKSLPPVLELLRQERYQLSLSELVYTIPDLENQIRDSLVSQLDPQISAYASLLGRKKYNVTNVDLISNFQSPAGTGCSDTSMSVNADTPDSYFDTLFTTLQSSSPGCIFPIRIEVELR